MSLISTGIYTLRLSLIFNTCCKVINIIPTTLPSLPFYYQPHNVLFPDSFHGRKQSLPCNLEHSFFSTAASSFECLLCCLLRCYLNMFTCFIARGYWGPSPSTAAQLFLHNIGIVMNTCPFLPHSSFNHNKSGLPLQYSARIRSTETGVLRRKKKNKQMSSLGFNLHLLMLSY